MINVPLSNRPKITTTDVIAGYITRYFVQSISTKKIVEVDKNQYDVFKNNPFYQSLKIKWIIGGYDKDTTAADGQPLYGAGHKNQVSLDFYDKKMPGLTKMIRNPLEYFSGKIV